MYLFEEYIKRHNLNVPLIYHNSKSTVLLKQKDILVSWKVLSFSWTIIPRHPSYYEIVLGQPVHDGYQPGLLIQNCRGYPKECHWDEYDGQVKHICGQLKQEGYQAIVGREKALAAWEIFLYIYDSYLARLMDKAFFWFVEQSINADLSVSVRSNACRVAKKMVMDKDSKLADALIYQIMPLVRDDSDWLARIINE
jgi:hypothetical protein